MNVGSLLGALTGSGGPAVEIRLTPPSSQDIVAMDHAPSWKLHRNPFWRVKHPASDKLITPQTSSLLQQQQFAQGYFENSVHAPHQQRANHQSSPQFTGSSSDPLTDSSSIVYAYEASQDVQGAVILRLPPGKKVEHLGIKVQFIGRIDMSIGVHEGRPHYDFISLSKELAPPGSLYQTETMYTFHFKNMDKEFESYCGRNVAVRYIVKVKVERKFLPPLKQEQDVWVQFRGQEPISHESIKMEVGIEDCLHIEFEYARRQYHLRDTITGKIHFLLVQIKIKHMELAVIRRETSGEGVALAAATDATNQGSSSNSNVDAAGNIFTETQTLVKYEIMDGAPVKGEVIPVKLSLQGIPADLTPTYTAVNNRFSVRYFLNLVLVDEDDRRYFKQQEIILWRKDLG
jgi:vacuolar protein sorting-associated protein 26